MRFHSQYRGGRVSLFFAPGPLFYVIIYDPYKPYYCITYDLSDHPMYAYIAHIGFSHGSQGHHTGGMTESVGHLPIQKLNDILQMTSHLQFPPQISE